MQDAEKKRRIRRTVITLVVVAVGLYAGFILYTFSMVPHG
jgi:hypothetical protein